MRKEGEDEIYKILKYYYKNEPKPFHAVVFGTIDLNDSKQNQTPQFYCCGTQTLYPRGARVTEESIFWVASLSKIVTAAAVMKCIELHPNILDLDTDVGTFVPELANPQVIIGFETSNQEVEGVGKKPVVKPAKGNVTLRRLMSHTSGLAYEATSPLLMKWKQYHDLPLHLNGNFTGTIEPYTHPLVFEPGEGWVYGPGVDWAGRVVERVSGMSLEEFLRENVFEKVDGVAGMSFKPLSHIPDFERRRVGIVAKDDQTGELRMLEKEKGEETYPANPHDCLGGIGLFSTPRAFMQFLGILLKGGEGILKKESVDEILRNQIEKDEVLAYANSLLGSEFMVKSGMKRALTAGKRVEVGLGVFIGFDNDEVEEKKGGEKKKRGRGEGTISGMGLPNCTWWIDRERGVASAMFFQSVPPLDEVLAGISQEVEGVFYRYL
ncbi:beta-lactamase/transpeptidase-like protein [Rhexocercosporidium sp. MPI-PUGE-AT-0058]|nr:beta-lactamase/transpeptidase-like protein [Rhexocercosporidium sp. MPI-PUGE-AT-0058]